MRKWLTGCKALHRQRDLRFCTGDRASHNRALSNRPYISRGIKHGFCRDGNLRHGRGGAWLRLRLRLSWKRFGVGNVEWSPQVDVGDKGHGIQMVVVTGGAGYNVMDNWRLTLQVRVEGVKGTGEKWAGPNGTLAGLRRRLLTHLIKGVKGRL